MQPKIYWKSINATERARVAKTAKTTVGYLIQIVFGFSMPSAKLALRLEKATNFAVSREDWRPDLYPPKSVASASQKRANV